jgi:exosome complex component CSL4
MGEQSVADGFVIPGERLAPCGTMWISGRGTYVFQGHIFASVVGLKQEVPPEGVAHGQTVEVVQLRNGGQTIQPQIGDTVIAKVTKVTPRQASCIIVSVNDCTINENFPAVIRQEDVRSTETDTVEIYNSFMPGDVINAKVPHER